MKLSPSIAISCTALLFSLAGTGYAVTSLPKNSVGTTQLRLAAVTSTKVKDGSLKTVDFAPGQLPAGPTGPQGAPGAVGPRGPSGIVEGVNRVGGGLNPSPSTVQFFGAPVTVNVPTATSRVLVIADNGFGAGASGANALNLFVCYRPPGGALTPVGYGILGVTLPASVRVPMGLSKILTLDPGTYEVGMCGTGGNGWVNNDYGSTTALVFTTT